MIYYKFFVFNALKGDGACIYYLLIYIYIYVCMYVYYHLIMKNVIIK